MTGSSQALSVDERRVARASVLEALTDGCFGDSKTDRAVAERLLSSLSSSGSGQESAVELTVAEVRLVIRALAHALVAIEPWEMELRVGFAAPQVEAFRARLTNENRSA